MSKIKKLAFILGIVFAIVFSFVVFFHMQYVVPIIMYHSVNPNAPVENRLVVSPQTFDRQMCFLRKHHYNILTLEQLASLIREKKRIPPRSIAITFDDGYRDNYTYAFAILKKYNIVATLFIIINEVGRPENDRLHWNEIKEMQDSGLVTFGSHTLGPQPLIDIKDERETGRQISESKKILEEKLGCKVNLFSYPEGRFNDKIRQWVIDAGYKAAVATSPGKRFASDDVFALKRLRISSNCNNLFVFWVETSGIYTFMKEHRHK